MTLPKLTGIQLWTLIYRILVMAGFCVMLYLYSVFATHQEVKASVQELRQTTQEQVMPLVALPARVQALELFTTDQRVFQLKVDGQTMAIREDLATIKAVLGQQIDGQKRILDVLDQMRADAGKKKNP